MSSNLPNTEQSSTASTTDSAPLHIAVSTPGMSNDSPGNLCPSMFEHLSTSDETDQSLQPSTNEEDMEQTVPPNQN